MSENRLIQELAQDLPEAQARSIIERQFDDLVAELSATERQIYSQADSFFSSNPNGGKGFARGGNDAIGNDEFADLVGACPSNSFSGDTLVQMADGSLASIADVQVGDQVLAYDFDTGETVSRDVTATLPHEDWLLEAHLSDGSVLEVTEDHRFWSVTDNAWVELQDLDTTDQLLTPDGATVTVDFLDWDTGADAPAWDLTVQGEHNFFVAADQSAEPVLVHNQGSIAAFCGVPVSPRHSALAGTDESLTLSQRSDLGLALRELGDESPSALDDVLDALVASGDDDTIRVLVGRAGEFPQQLKAAALKGWTDDYLSRPLLWTEDTLTFTGDVTRTVRFREPGPAVQDPANVWGVTDAHLEKHFLGNGEPSLSVFSNGTFPEWLDATEDLLTREITRAPYDLGVESDGVVRMYNRIRGDFEAADGSSFRLEIVLHVRDDGTYDYVTWLTKFTQNGFR